MHKFQLTGKGVTYRNKHQNREAEHFIQAENRAPGIQVWTDPCGTLMGRAFSTLKQIGELLTIDWHILFSKHGMPSSGSAVVNNMAVQMNQ